MCGRYVIRSPAAELAYRFTVEQGLPTLVPRFNAAPTQELPVIRWNPKTGLRQLDLLRWGLVPHWANDTSNAAKLINARAETLEERPSFRGAYARRRCLVPANAFYEWSQTPPKQPYAISTHQGLFAMAGLWEGWQDPASAQWHRTFTTVTTHANNLLSALHHRMPVILPEAAWAGWLGESPCCLSTMLIPYADEELHLWKVSSAVGNIKNDTETLLDSEPTQYERHLI